MSDDEDHEGFATSYTALVASVTGSGQERQAKKMSRLPCQLASIMLCCFQRCWGCAGLS